MAGEKDRRFVGLVILGMALICTLPHVLIPLLKPGDLPSMPILRKAISPITEDEVLEGGRINKVFHGEVIPLEGYLYEHRFTPQPREWMPHFILGVITLLTGSLERTFLLGDLVLAPLLCFVIYQFVFYLTRVRAASILIAISVLFFQNLMGPLEYFPSRGLNEWRGIVAFFSSFSQPIPFLFTRLPHPELSYTFFWVALIFLFRMLDRVGKRTIWLAGISGGFLFYIYPYYWQTLYIGLGFLGLYFLAKREWNQVGKIFFVCLIALGVSLPFWYQMFQAFQLPYSEEFWLRHNLKEGRYLFKFLTLKYVFVLGLGLLMAGASNRRTVYLACFLLAGILCLNQQLITGRTIQPDHWTSRILNPWSILFLGYGLTTLVTKGKRRGTSDRGSDSENAAELCLPPRIRKAVRLAIFTILIWAAWIQVSYSLASNLSHPLLREMEPHLRAFGWLEANARDTDVVMTCNPEIMELMNAYTHTYQYLVNTSLSAVSFAEAEDRILTAYKILGVRTAYLEEQLARSSEDPDRWSYYEKFVAPARRDPQGVLKDIYEKDSWLHTFFYTRYYFDRDSLRTTVYRHPPDITEKILQHSYRYVPLPERERWLGAYARLTTDPAVLLNKFKLDYLYFGPYERSIATRKPDEIAYFRKVYEDQVGGIEIYKVVRS